MVFRIGNLENSGGGGGSQFEYPAWIWPDVRIDSTFILPSAETEVQSYFGDLTGLTLELSSSIGTYIHTFATTPASLMDLVAEASATFDGSGVSFIRTGGGDQNGMMFGIEAKGQSAYFSLYGTAVAALGFVEGYHANEQTQRTMAAATRDLYDISSNNTLDNILSTMLAELETMKQQVATLGGA